MPLPKPPVNSELLSHVQGYSQHGTSSSENTQMSEGKGETRMEGERGKNNNTMRSADSASAGSSSSASSFIKNPFVASAPSLLTPMPAPQGFNVPPAVVPAPAPDDPTEGSPQSVENPESKPEDAKSVKMRLLQEVLLTQRGILETQHAMLALLN